jgi:transmembrane sensor
MVENYLEPEELLSDESFLAWYFKTGSVANPENEKEWEQWLAAGPDRHELVQQAVKLLDTIQIREKELPAAQAMAAEKALFDKIQKNPKISEPLSIPPKATPLTTATATSTAFHLNRRRWLVAAAILVLIVSGMLVTKTFFSGKALLRTEYGQIRQQELPDGTDVVVNANSQLSYSSGWKDGVDREVWLNGEAFFHVRKTPMKSRFIVHTDHFDIIVTGTQFNVVNRNGRDNVMLKEGSVILHIPDCDKTNPGSCRDLSMVPGDYVEYGSAQLEKKLVKDDSLTAWREQVLKFNETPVSELVTIIRDQYGVTVKLADDSVKDKTVTGILSNKNLDVLLKAVEATGICEVVRQDGDIIIRSHPKQ